MVGCGVGEDMLGGDTSSSSGAKPPFLPMAGQVCCERWMVDGGWRMLGQMWPPKWLVLMCPKGVFSCPFLFHPVPRVVAQGAMISSLRDFLLFEGNFALFWSCVRVCIGFIGFFLGGWSFLA